MILSENTTEQLSTGAIAITLFSALIGGHLTANYFLYTPSNDTMVLFMKIVGGIVLLNSFYFVICSILIIANIPKRMCLLKATLFMLINIPISIGYLSLVFGATL